MCSIQVIREAEVGWAGGAGCGRRNRVELTVPLAVNVEDVATPFTSVVAVVRLLPPVKVPLAPDDGAVKVTSTPLVGFPFVVTVALSGEAKAVLTVALCGVPPVAVMISETEEVLVRVKLAGVAIPGAVAVTV